MPREPKPIDHTDETAMPDDSEITAENIVTDRHTTAGNPIPTDANNSPTHPVMEPLGQATSPESDAASKAELLSDPDDDSNDAPSEPTQRITLTLPASMVAALKAHADENDVSVSEAATTLFTTTGTVAPHQNY